MIHVLGSEHDLHQRVKAGIREITALPYIMTAGQRHMNPGDQMSNHSRNEKKSCLRWCLSFMLPRIKSKMKILVQVIYQWSDLNKKGVVLVFYAT